ncbi:hypothetical protein [Desulfocurvibacter africanus]|uniref:DGQHR domain protein n=1 Tax=Desulfocurvibacter africanus subsp. africanus str. Walvis Bay TaxID=690850 RepID=F3YZA3_DESAF|nr:hypothetical protein [Desulfocurvibacter africanus]EGJ50859.1 hypothetical protein Desaf_2537 [Desulfocurvibacter africanus subsp. africanus str. Walvis Bay]
MRYEYQAIGIKQTDESPWIILTAAPSREIQEWGGIPEKRLVDGKETTGFQREFNKNRLNELKQFFSDKCNVAQGTLLCAYRDIENSTVSFISDDKNERFKIGTLVIECEDATNHSITELFGRLVNQIESRLDTLKTRELSVDTLNILKTRANNQHSGLNLKFESPEDEEQEEDDEENIEEDTIDKALELEEAHIHDFWEEVKARHHILKEIGNFQGDEFLGYNKNALLSYLKPIVIVDGQHRLTGATNATEDEIDNDDTCKIEIAKRVDAGEDESLIHRDLEIRYSRILPISLLMSSDPAEHVFQFVIVNQKAVSMSPPLLGTIVSTSLSEEELGRVKGRIESSGIPLEDSRAVTILTKRDDSPFKGKIQKGLRGDSRELLAWSVFKTIVKIFKELSGGKLYHETKNDYAKLWSDKYLVNSNIIAKWSEKGYSSPKQYWSSLDGPWMEVFITFWTSVKDYFASDDSQDWHYWGNPVKSNLFNKPSLTILATDFFQYLTEKELVINDASEVTDIVARWLNDINKNYFNKDWQLKNQKKESVGIMKKWSSLWVEYRKGGGGRLPNSGQYNKPKKD